MFTTPNISPRLFSTYFAGFLLLLCATMATAHEEQDLCYPLAHGEDGMGSSNFKYIPILFIDSYWSSFINVTNVSRKPVNVKIAFNDVNNTPYVPALVRPKYNFNSNNNPNHIQTGGAILRPGESGEIWVHDSSSPSPLKGKITWQADGCLERAITATVRNFHVSSTRFSQGLFPLNNGEPF